MSEDLKYYKSTLRNLSNPTVAKLLAQKADELSAGLADKNLSEEEKEEVKKQKSKLMSTIKYEGIDFKDDRDGFFVTKYKSDYLETDDVSEAEAIGYGAMLGVTDTVRGVQQLTGIGKEELEKQQQRLRRLMQNKEYGGKVMAAYMGGAVADPIGWILPVAKAYKVATIGAKVKKMAATGVVTGGIVGATGYVDEQMDSLVGDGKMSRVEQAGIGAVAGGVLAPVIGAGVNVYKYARNKEYLPLREIVTPEPVKTRIIADDKTVAKATTSKAATEASIIDSSIKKPSIVEPSVPISKRKVDVAIEDGKPKLTKEVKPTMASKVTDFSDTISEKSLYGMVQNNLLSSAGTVGGFASGWNSVDDTESTASKLYTAFLYATIGGFGGKIIPKIPVTKNVKGKWQDLGFTEPKNIGDIGGDLFRDRYSLRNYPTFVKYLDDLSVDQNLYTGKMKDVSDKLKVLSDSDKKTLYKIMVGEGEEIEALAKLNTESRNLIKELGEIAVERGMIKRETFLQNLETYLHRTYTSNIENATKGMNAKQRSAFITKMKSNFSSVKVIGDQIKPRGLLKTVTLGDYLKVWNKQKAETHLNRISKDSGLDAVAKANGVDIKVRPEDLNHKGWEFLDDIIKTKDGYFRVIKRGEPVQDAAGKFVRLGDVLSSEKIVVTDAIKIRWQLTKAQREALGEIEDASFALMKTAELLIRDTTTIAFFNKTARTYGKTQKELIDSGLDLKQIDELYEKVPDTAIIKESKLFGKTGTTKIDPDEVTSLKSYGELSGKYLPREIANEIGDLDRISSFLRASVGNKGIGLSKAGESNFIAQFYAKYRRLNTFWKKTKTAYNPAVHVNNVVSNVVLYDFAGAAYRHLHHARRAMFQGRKNGLFRLAEDTGLLNKSFIDVEMKEVQAVWKKAYMDGYIKSTDDLSTLLDGSMQNTLTFQKELKRLSSLKKKVGDVAFKPLEILENLYKQEDYFFRLGVFRDRIEKGLQGKLKSQVKLGRLGLTDSDKKVVQKILDGEYVDITKPGMENVKSLIQYSKNEGVKWFIDYDIQAPGINFLRATVTPFLAYTYRVVPLLAEAAITRPQKVAKWAALAYGMDIVSSNVYYDTATGEVNTSNQLKKFNQGTGSIKDVAFNPGTEAERMLLPEYERGNLFGFPGFPNKILRVPITTDGVPHYIDVTRWTPGGDIFEVRQGNGNIPFIPLALQPSFGALGSIMAAGSGFDSFRQQSLPGYGLDGWSDLKIQGKSLLLDFMPNIIILGYDGTGSYSYLKVREALARQKKDGMFNLIPGYDKPREGAPAKANVFQDDLTVLNAVLHTFGVKIRPIEYSKLTVRKRAEAAGKIEKLIDQVRAAGKKVKKGTITEAQFREQRLKLKEQRDEIRKEYNDILDEATSLWSKFKDPMENPIWPFETEGEKQERQGMLMDAIQDDPTLYYKEKNETPAPYKIIRKNATKYNIDSEVIEGIVVAESKFDPRIVGDRDLKNRAYGLMQIRKPALDDVNDFYNLGYTEEDLMDPEINLEVGIAYLAMQRDKYGIYDINEMIQSYNAGPGNKSKLYLEKVLADINRERV